MSLKYRAIYTANYFFPAFARPISNASEYLEKFEHKGDSVD